MCHLGCVKRTIVAVLLGSGFTFDSMAAGSKVELRQSDDGWELLRNGEPYRILGVGGSGPLARAVFPGKTA